MTNRSILLPPESITEIPVSCMEHGRWHFVGEHFAPAPQNAPSKVRRKAREAEADASYRAEHMGPGSRSSYRDLSAAQGMVWEEIGRFESKLGRASDTGALDALYERRRGEMADWTQAFPLVEGQTGILAFLGGIPLALDAMGAPALYAKTHRRMLTGYILDAMEAWDPGHDTPKPTSADAEEFVQAFRRAERVPSDSVGSGEYRILRGLVLGGELVDDARTVHVSAFPTMDWRHRDDTSTNGRHTGGPIARPSRRRRGF